MSSLDRYLRRWTDAPFARLIRPPLPPIEPELRAPRPRPMVWVLPERAPPWYTQLLRDGRAVRAWVYSHQAWKDSDGPEVRARYAFEAEDGSLIVGHFSGSYDGYDFAMNQDFSRFIESAIRLRGTFTVLHPPGRPWEHRIYGNLQARLFIPVVELAQRLAAGGQETPRQRQALREQLAPAFASLLQPEYYDMTSRFIRRGVKAEGYYDHARLALDAIERGEASLEALQLLERVQRGLWAAT